jgi:hypothetical protein
VGPGVAGRGEGFQIQLTAKQRLQTSRPRAARLSSRAAGAPNPVTGKPTPGELVPLLQIAPSRTDTERLLLASPELADVLSAIISRLRGPGGDVPLTDAVGDPLMFSPHDFRRILSA